MKHTLLAIAMVTMLGSAGNVAADDSKLLEGLVARLEALQSVVAALKAEVSTKQDAMDCLYQVGSDLIVEECNLHVRNGTDMTGSYWTVPNGLGNLIVGYNEDHWKGSEKTGSHNVIVGAGHTYTGHSGLVTGLSSTIDGNYAAVIGGTDNVASERSTVSGGHYNKATGWFATVSGGTNNTASGTLSSVSGGVYNEASGSYSSVSGGEENTASGGSSSVSGGGNNTASGQYSSVSGGGNNIAGGQYSSVSGEAWNWTMTDYETLP